jgi:hypothetical protein
MKAAPAAAKTSAPTRKGNLAVFHFWTGAGNWSIGGLASEGGLFHGAAEHGSEVEESELAGAPVYWRSFMEETEPAARRSWPHGV